MSVHATGARTSMQRFIGVSLGGGRGKSTAVARLEVERDSAALTVAEARNREGQRGGGAMEPGAGAPFRDAVLLRWLGRWVDERTAVGFDTPLTLPPCMRCTLPCPGVEACTVPVVAWMREHGANLVVRTGRTDPGKPAVTPYTQRATELVLERLLLQPREALGQGMGPLAARSVYLRRALWPRLRLHENLIEVHPRATLLRLFGEEDERRTRRGDNEDVREARKEVLSRLAEGLKFDRVWPELVVRDSRVFHAVVVAFTVYCWAAEGWRGPEDLLTSSSERVRDGVSALGNLWMDDGWIHSPPRRRGPTAEGADGS